MQQTSRGGGAQPSDSSSPSPSSEKVKRLQVPILSVPVGDILYRIQ